MTSSLMPVAEALRLVLDGVTPLPPEPTPLGDAHGRVLATDLAARRTQPPADVSAMDGYAVRSVDVAAANAPTKLKFIGVVRAGHPFEGTVGPGEAARIFTGGVIPPGADTIVIQENTTREGDTVVVQTASSKGRHIRLAGLDFKAGSVLLAKGRRLTDRDLALAAAMNHPSVPVHRLPKVAVLATGDELVMPGDEPGFGEIVYSNGYATMAMARGEGCASSISASCRTGSRKRQPPFDARERPKPTSWSPRAALRSATTTLCSRHSPPKVSRCPSGKWRCARAVR